MKNAPAEYPQLVEPPAAEPAAEPDPETPGEHLVDVAQPFPVYVHPQAHKTIAEFALAESTFKNKVKPHDIWLRAMEEFFERNGLKGPVRAKEKPRKRKVRREILL
jgi:hypothetical protein